METDLWVMRPCLEGMVKYESLIDGTLDLADLERLNEALDVRNENQARVNEAVERERERNQRG